MKRVILNVASLLCLLTGFSQNPVDDIVAQAKTIKTLSADFVQTKSIASLSQPAISYGKLFFSTPDKMRWQQNKPSLFLMIFDGENAIIKIGDQPAQEFNASSNRMIKELSLIIIGGISGELFTKQKNYEISFSEVDCLKKAKLVPRNRQMRKYISSIEVEFNSDWLAEQIILNEGNGNKTTIRFTAIKTNSVVSDTLFILK